MTTIRLLACAPLLLTGACATLFPGYQPPANAAVFSQAGAEQMATCIAQAAGTSPVSAARGYAVDVPEQSGSTRLSIVRDSMQTSVIMPENAEPAGRAAQIAVDCAIKLTPQDRPAA